MNQLICEDQIMWWRMTKPVLALGFFLTLAINIVFIIDLTAEIASDKVTDTNIENLNSFERTFAGRKLFKSERHKLLKVKKDYTEGKALDIQVVSSRREVTMTVNGVEVAVSDKRNSVGINVFVLNEESGAVMAKRNFNTYMDKQESADLVKFISSLNEERVICLAVKDEATYKLTNQARQFLRSYGSSFISQLQWRDMWSMVVQRIGGKPFVHSEGYQRSPSRDEWAAPVKLRTTVKRRPDNFIQCADKIDSEMKHRWRDFCIKYDGYESLCNCKHFSTDMVEINPPPLSNGDVVDLPVAVMAGNRPYYLYRMLRTLQRVQGLDRSLVTVYIEGLHEEPAAVARVFGLSVEQHKPVGQDTARITQHYKNSLASAFERHPKAKHLVILEEDLDVSPDILDYFSQVLPVMEKDKSVYCISAWNDQSYIHSSSDPTGLYRIEGMPGLGWVLSRRLFKEELEKKWPRPQDQMDWDIWMRSQEIRKERECIIPDVSRTFHFGSKGHNINPYMQKLYFTKRAINYKTNLKFNVGLLDAFNYEKEIERLIRTSVLLDHSKSPCTHRDFVSDTRNQTFLFYIHMKHEHDWSTWMNVASCFHLWDMDARGYHKGMWRFWIKGNHILVIGYPASPYSKFKHEEIKPLVIAKKKRETPSEWFMS